MFQSATVKLTAWYLAIVMAISLMFSAVVYHVGSNELANGLSRQTARIYRDFPIFDDSPYLKPGNDVRLGQHHLLAQLVVFNFFVLLAAGLASYYLARRTLLPIEAAHARQKRFTADVSHELRTPITALKMESEVALLDPKAPRKELKRVLESNLEEAGKLDMLVNNLLRLSQMDDGEVRLGFETVDISELVGAVLPELQKLADMKHITVVNDVGSGSVPGDRAALGQLLTILADNAIKYSPEKSSVWLESSLTPHHVRLSVRDQGAGIEPAALDHVFDRFYRADSSRHKETKEGFGLGLSIAKMIADVHHATITLKSRVGQGTTATVNLPRTQQH